MFVLIVQSLAFQFKFETNRDVTHNLHYAIESHPRVCDTERPKMMYWTETCDAEDCHCHHLYL